MILSDLNENINPNDTFWKVKEVYFISQLESAVKIQLFHPSAECYRRKESTQVGNSQKGYVACKLFQHASLAFSLLVLAGDVEINPGYRNLDDIRTTRGLKLVHLNIRSLRQKADLTRLEGLDNKTIDVITLSETWLDDTFQDDELALCGFTCVRRDRTTDKIRYGGVAVYVREGLPFRVRQDIDSGYNECLWIELNRNKCHPVIICCAYRAPDADLVHLSQIFITAFLILIWINAILFCLVILM